MTLLDLINARDLSRFAEEVAAAPQARTLRAALNIVMDARQEYIDAAAHATARRAELVRQHEAAAAALAAAEEQLAGAQVEVARVEAALAAVPADVAPRPVDSDDVHRVAAAYTAWRGVLAMVQ
jgi:hypothetical protein